MGRLVEQMVLFCNKDIIDEANKEKLSGEQDIPHITEAEFHRHFTRHGNDFGMKAVVRSDWIDEMLHSIWEQDCWVEVRQCFLFYYNCSYCFFLHRRRWSQARMSTGHHACVTTA